MKSRLGYDLGPWNIHEQTEFRSKQYFSEKRNNEAAKLILPKLQKMIISHSPAKHVQIKLRQFKQKAQEQLKINPVQIQLLDRPNQERNTSDFYSTKKYKTNSSNPPMISFYNKKHPKIKRLKQKNSTKINFLHEKKNQSEQQDSTKRNLSNINLMQRCLNSTQTKKKSNRSVSFQGDEKEMGRKNSLSKLITYLKNSENQVSWTQRVQTYLRKEQFNGVSRYSLQNHNFNINSISLDEQAFHPYKEVQKFCHLLRKKPLNEIKKKQ